MSWRKKILNFLSVEESKALIFINMRDNLDKIAPVLKKVISERRKSFVLVCFNSQPPLCLRGLDIDIRLSEDYLKNEDYDQIDKYVFYDITRRWYLTDKEGLKDITEFENIHLGSLVEYEFQLFLMPRVKNLMIVKKAIESVKPSKVIVMEDAAELSEAAELAGKILGIPILKLRFQYRNLMEDIRARMADTAEFLIDKFMRLALLSTHYYKNTVGIDARLYSQLNCRNQSGYLPAPLEKGVRIRLKILKGKMLYLPFYFPSSYKIKFRQELFAEKWEGLKGNPDFRYVFGYQGVCIWELVEDKLRDFFLQSFPRIAKNIRLFKKIADEKSIKLFVMRHDVRELEKSIVMAARQFNLHTLVIQHGIMAENNGHDIIYAGKMAIWGQAYRERYAGLGNDKEKFIVTGNPKYDALYNRDNGLNKGKICQILRLKPEKKIIVLATQPVMKLSAYRTDDESEILFREVLSAMKEFPQEQLIIKLHPYEDAGMYKRVLGESGFKNTVITKNLNIWDLINIADLLITIASTVALEAIIMGKPVMTIKLGKRKSFIPYEERGAVLGVESAEFIAPSLKQVLENSSLREKLTINARQFMQDYAYKIDGQASQRVSELIARLAGQPQ